MSVGPISLVKTINWNFQDHDARLFGDPLRFAELATHEEIRCLAT